jgi:membrane protein insertase Oxa1/YidC/SpoIIIJ
MGMPPNPQQATANKITPVMITAMFLFFPLPAGVLLYMVIANIFQALQTFLLTRETLPDNLQAILDKQKSQQVVTATATARWLRGPAALRTEVQEVALPLTHGGRPAPGTDPGTQARPGPWAPVDR